MPIISSGWELEIKVEDVLFAQAADAAVLSRRSPRLIEVVEKAIEDAHGLLSPMVAYKVIEVESFQNEMLTLHGGFILVNPLFTELMTNVRSVIIMVCTIGGALECVASTSADEDITYSFALDSVGSVAVDQLSTLACRYFESQMNIKGWQTTIAITPGMIGWDLQEGQNQVFGILADLNHGVKLTASGLMIPLKSVSMMIGAGPEVKHGGLSCDYCELKDRCQFQKQSRNDKKDCA
jgi:hypothetical protein